MDTSCRDDDALKKRILKFLRDNRDTGADTSDYIDEEHLELAEADGLCSEVKSAMHQISAVWTEIGLFGTNRAKRRNEFLASFRDLVQQYLDHESRCAQLIKDQQHQYVAQINQLTEELKIDPWTPPTAQTLLYTVNRLVDRFEELRSIKAERVDKWLELNQEHASCAKLLGMDDRPVIASSEVPTEQDIQTLQTRVLELRATLSKRKKEFSVIKEKVLDLLDLLDLSQNCDEVKTYFVEESHLAYSDSLIKNFERFSAKLLAKYRENLSLKDQLLKKLDELWDTLEIPLYERDQELAGLDGCKPNTLKELKSLLAKYQELKRQNLGKFIEKVRTEILGYWERCYVKQEDRNSFRIYLSQSDYDEALLTAHEQELERWKTYYEVNKNLFDSFEKWQDSWAKLIELEEQCNDPGRFNNRGGVLLKQEKEKKRLQKELQRCENTIKVLAEKWSATNGGIFTIDGQHVADYIESQKLQHQEFKENEKCLRMKTKEQELRLGSTSVRASPMPRVKPSSAIRGNNAPSYKKQQDNALTGSARKRVVTSSKSKPESAKIPRLRTPVDSFLASRATRSKRLFGQTPKENLETYGTKVLNSTFQKDDSPHTFRIYGNLDRRKSKSYTLVQRPNIDDLSLSPVRISNEI